MNRKRAFVAAAVTLTVAALLLAVSWVDAKLEARRASVVLESIRVLSAGQSTEAEILAVGTRYGASIVKSAGTTEVTWRFANVPLAAMRLSTPSRLTIALVAKEGKLSYLELAERFGRRVGYGYTLFETSSFEFRGKSTPFFATFTGTCARIWKVIVYLTPEASADQKKAAFSVATDCLARIGGCSTAKEFVPLLDFSHQCSNQAALVR